MQRHPTGAFFGAQTATGGGWGGRSCLCCGVGGGFLLVKALAGVVA
ncbi:MAG: hypothetical protein ABF570_06225 [Acetobacter syzygii]